MDAVRFSLVEYGFVAMHGRLVQHLVSVFLQNAKVDMANYMCVRRRRSIQLILSTRKVHFRLP